MNKPPPPKFIDQPGIRSEFIDSRRAAEAIMRELPKYRLPGYSRDLVKRADVERLFEDGVVDAITQRARKRREAA